MRISIISLLYGIFLLITRPIWLLLGHKHKYRKIGEGFKFDRTTPDKPTTKHYIIERCVCGKIKECNYEG
jgi:hypothetical protein